MTNQNNNTANHINDADHIFAVIEAAWNGASMNWNSEALAALYAENALLFGGRRDHSVGKQAICKYFASYNGIIESASLALQDQHFRSLGAECLLTQGYGQFSFVLCNGQTFLCLMRTTLVVELQENKWKICQHHFSELPTTPTVSLC